MKPCDGSFCACSCHAGTLPLDWQGRMESPGASEAYRGYDSGGPDRPSFGVEIDMEIDDPRTRYATIQKLINGRTAWAVEALERINELATVDRGEYSHDQFVRILTVAREAIRRAAGHP